MAIGQQREQNRTASRTVKLARRGLRQQSALPVIRSHYPTFRQGKRVQFAATPVRDIPSLAILKMPSATADLFATSQEHKALLKRRFTDFSSLA